jgi:hypothetical protein
MYDDGSVISLFLVSFLFYSLSLFRCIRLLVMDLPTFSTLFLHPPFCPNFILGSANAPKMTASFHSSARREEEAKETSSEVAEKGGFMGTGLSHLYAIPVGVAFGVPILEFNWFVVNEETLVSHHCCYHEETK